MTVYVLITSDGAIGGVYSNKNKLVQDLTTVLVATAIDHVETWEVDLGFVNNLKVSKTTTVTIEN